MRDSDQSSVDERYKMRRTDLTLSHQATNGNTFPQLLLQVYALPCKRADLVELYFLLSENAIQQENRLGKVR